MKQMIKAVHVGLLVALFATLFTFANPVTPAAYADVDCSTYDPAQHQLSPGKQIPIPESGSFDIADFPPRKPLQIECTPKVIRSVIVTFSPPDITGTIDSISIVRGTPPVGVKKFQNTDDWTDVVPEFGCSNIKVKNGDDLTLVCGGPAVLKPGATFYTAKGSNFKSASKGKLTFKVDFSDDFSDQYKKIYGLPEDDTEKSVTSTFDL